MTSRHFGLNKNGRPSLGGASDKPSARAESPRDLYPLPSGSIHKFTAEDDMRIRERVALSAVAVFFSFVLISPLLVAAVMMKFK